MNKKYNQLILITCIPIVLILIQQYLHFKQWIDFSFYKIAFIIPPLLFIFLNKMHINKDILKFYNWRNNLSLTILTGFSVFCIFWFVYFLIGNSLLDKQYIIETINKQFSINYKTVITSGILVILLSSFIEEFYYRAFSFNLLSKHNKKIAYLLPSFIYTLQHVLFMYHWFSWLILTIAIVSLFVFALLCSMFYHKTQSIVSCWIIHLFGDLAMMTIGMHLIFKC